MADTSTMAPPSLPQPPTAGAMPGQPAYNNGAAGQMPPPNLAINTTNMTQDGQPQGPFTAGGSRAAPEPNKRALYVGGLDPRVTEDVLKQIFETTGHVQSVKIIPDKNVSFACDGCIEYRLQPSARVRASVCHLCARVCNPLLQLYDSNQMEMWS